MTADHVPVRAADVYVVVGDPDGHVHVYPDEYRAGLLATVYVGANLDGELFALSAAEWADKRPMIARMLAAHGGRIVEHPDLALNELSAVEGTCEECHAAPGTSCAPDCPLHH